MYLWGFHVYAMVLMCVEVRRACGRSLRVHLRSSVLTTDACASRARPEAQVYRRPCFFPVVNKLVSLFPT